MGSIKCACFSHTGRVRKENEDNFLFFGRTLEEKNRGLKRPIKANCCSDDNATMLAVFDGIGGEANGETAAFEAAQTLRGLVHTFSEFAIPEKQFLKRCCICMSDAVYLKSLELDTQTWDRPLQYYSL